MAENIICNPLCTPARHWQYFPCFTLVKEVYGKFIHNIESPAEYSNEHHTFLFIRDMSSYSVGVNQPWCPVIRGLGHVSRNVKVASTIHGFPYKCVIHSQDMYVGKRLRAGLWCQQGKLCVCLQYVRGKVEISIQVAQVILASLSLFQVLDQKSSSILLRNINIILYYPLPWTLKQNKKVKYQKHWIGLTNCNIT